MALVTLGKGHTVSEVMRKKAALKDKKPYSRVYIEPQKSIAEQRAEANIRALTKAAKGLEYRRGKVMEKQKAAPTKKETQTQASTSNNERNRAAALEDNKSTTEEMDTEQTRKNQNQNE